MPPLLEERILIADDERVIADALAIILGQIGFGIRAVSSGEGALEIADFFLPDMFTSNICMDGMTGFEAAVNLSMGDSKSWRSLLRRWRHNAGCRYVPSWAD